MLSKSILFLFALNFVFPLAAQESLAPYLSLKMPQPTQKDLKQREIEKRLSDYVNGISGASKKSGIPLNENSQKYLNCLQNRVRSQNLGGLKDLAKFCPGDMFSDHQLIKKLGLPTPQEFNQSLAQQAFELQSKIDQFQTQDTHVVVNDYLRLYEVGAEGADLSHADPNVVALSRDVQSIVVKLHQSPNFKSYVKDLENRGLNSGQEELLELSELLSSLDGTNPACMQIKDEAEEHPEKKLLRYLRGMKKDGHQDTGNIFLGVQTEEDLSKLKSFRFYDGETFYYLYRSNVEGNNEERWVLARLEKDGKTSFRFYQIYYEQGKGEALSRAKDFNVFKPGNHQTTLKSGENSRIYFQSQEGLVVKRNEFSAPVVGNSMLPNGDLIISRVNMTYVGGNSFNQNNLSLTQDSVSFESVASSKNAKIWAASGGVKYYPLDNRWRVSSNVRVYDFLLGYSDNLSGDKEARGTYVFDRNFVTVDSNFRDGLKASAGREFMKGRGAATLTTDFRKTAEVKVIFIVQ